MSGKAWLGVAVVAPALAVAALADAADVDRLERFRRLATRYLAAAQLAPLDGADEAYREIWGVLDDEIVESLASGGVFASLAFLQDRLDGFAEVWGGATLRLLRVAPYTVGVFLLNDGPGGASVRVYGGAGRDATLLSAFVREGRPSVLPLPRTASGAVQFLVVWDGAASGRGTRALRLDLVRQHGDDFFVVWTTARLFPDGLVVREWRARGGDIAIRYELRYPGWLPGCEGQTEQEDVWRLSSDGSGFTRVSRRQFNAWHQEFHQVVERLYAALESHDRQALAALVPDPQVRARLPAGLVSDAACDALEPDGAATPTRVSTAALAPDRRPWTLTWERAGSRWRLVAADRVLE